LTTPNPALKDALRGLRFGLKSGRAAFRLSHQDLPVPLRRFAHQLDSAVNTVAKDIDTTSSDLAHRILDLSCTDEPKIHTLPDLQAHKKGDLLFAQFVYQGLIRAFALLECEEPLVSELSAVHAFAEVKANSGTDSDPSEFATDLLIAMRSLNVVQLPRISPDKGAELILVALHAVFFWFLADRFSEEDEDALLDVCCEVAHALKDRIIEINGERAETRLFLEQYAYCI
jgi:hypothetical protein